MLLIAGSGPTDMNGNSISVRQQPIHEADSKGLAPKGIATVRLKKRDASSAAAAKMSFRYVSTIM